MYSPEGARTPGPYTYTCSHTVCGNYRYMYMYNIKTDTYTTYQYLYLYCRCC